MDWLRSEDLKEEKEVTTPVFIIAVEERIYTLPLPRSARRTIGHAPHESRMPRLRPC